MDAERLLRDYRFYLKLERGMSPNTVASYASDVAAFLGTMPDADLARIDREDVLAYLADVQASGLSKRSQARLVSALRSFFKWTVLEGERKENPCDGIETPKLGRYLPAVLSVEEVTAILESVDTRSATGLRDRAILEMLYGCGLRVSEAVRLRISDIFFEEGFVRIIGKGDKQRIVPLGEVAAEAVLTYLREVPRSGGGETDFLFLNRNGKPLSRVSMFQLVKKQRRRGGPPHRPGNARPRIHPHHRDLHPHRLLHLAGRRPGAPSASIDPHVGLRPPQDDKECHSEQSEGIYIFKVSKMLPIFTDVNR